MLRLYKILTYLATPFIYLYLLKRKHDGKEDHKRFKERLGYASIPRPTGKVAWVHAASIGESLSVLPLVERLTEQYPDMKVLVTTGTVTSAGLLESRLPDRAFHQYVPVDHPLCVGRFLKYWKPTIALWVESELWPNLVDQTSKACRVIIINGRMSDSSFQHWEKYKSLGQQIAKLFSLVLAQTRDSADKYKELGCANVKCVGNLKYDAPPLPADSKKMGELVAEIGDRHVWVAASTHDGEEKHLIAAHKILKEQYSDVLTIIIPRHPKRGEAIQKLVKGAGLESALRSESQPITEDTDVYVANTVGELGVFYRLSSIAFIGGSLVTHGGQNPLEAARLESAVLFGPHMTNFLELSREMLASGAAIEVKDSEALAENIADMFRDHEKQEQITAAGLAFVQGKAGALNSTLKEIAPFIDSE